MVGSADTSFGSADSRAKIERPAVLFTEATPGIVSQQSPHTRNHGRKTGAAHLLRGDCPPRKPLIRERVGPFVTSADPKAASPRAVSLGANLWIYPCNADPAAEVLGLRPVRSATIESRTSRQKASGAELHLRRISGPSARGARVLSPADPDFFLCNIPPVQRVRKLNKLE